MSYIINNSRGNVVAIIADGTVNTTATDLALVGRALTDYGTYENENYVYLLENFANSTAPLQPILGQLWYNSTTDVISSYSTGNVFVALASQDYVQAQKISPVFTGIPTAPTASVNTSNTQIATTQFVLNQLGGGGSTNNILTSGLISAAGTVTGSSLIGTVVTTSGNITGGNVLTVGLVSATGNATVANMLTGGVVSATGNITGGNVLTVGIVSATGNVAGANFIGNVITPAGGVVSTTGNITGGNILTGGLISATGTITGSNLLTGGLISAAGAITGANITGANLLTSGSISAAGAITGASIVGGVMTGTSVSVSGAVIGSSVNATAHTGTTASLSGNVTGGNILTGGFISVTGDITTSNTIIADTVIANTITTTGTSSAFRLPNLTQGQINALSPQNGDMVYNTTANLPQIYQTGAWKNFTISFYS